MNHILIIGLGSIGKRHLRNLIYLGEKNISIVSTSENIPLEFKSFAIYANTEKALKENTFSHAFICTPTSNHISDLILLLKHYVANIYLEKPISNNLNNIEQVGHLLENSKKIVVGYDLHFDPGLMKIKELICEEKFGKIFSINALVGQYLPDWRPEQDYKQSMSAKIEKGGGVMLDLVHEFDYLRWLIGNPATVACFFQNNPNLEIETEDVADVLIQFENNSTATIHLDYHQKELVRNCMITCEKGTLFWDLAKSEVKIVGHNQETEIFSYAGFERNQRYVDSVQAFMNDADFDYRLTTFKEALISLKMVIAAKDSSINKQFISIN
ncbi:Gfo/Idh/MocA family oxidoreductase [Flavobacterium johnsoniae]|uniref:Gfo/Idh/MocA family protein n=1 Tax=Flavobacterium johnsoniae TaxID=986 RepID=UPI0025AF8C5B|nr:Gfo/Idh/MocA family oxidoreductase [Flavobacterium johnsoniae]WJS95127.1 Gfo/Idh/MocA family oxidoreductase [Flavobacterium johnsoniae]